MTHAPVPTAGPRKQIPIRNLYATALGWPDDGKIVVRSLDKNAAVKSVAVLGATATAPWKLTDEGLEVTLPEAKLSPYTVTVRIEGENLQPAKR